MILVFGSVNLDLVARVPRLPTPGETLSGTAFAALPGGKGANQALAARCAGAAVAIVGAVGSDPFAAPAMAGLASAGVDIAGVAIVGAPTGVALIHIDPMGENAITVIPGANALAAASSISHALWSRASTLLLQLETPMPEVIAAAVHARTRGIRVMLNAAPMQPLPPSLLAAIDVLIVNEHEAAALAAAFEIDVTLTALAEALATRLGIAVVLTLGADGAMAATDGMLLHAQPPPVSAVDTTGAGDALAGALAAALDRGDAWPTALAQAVAAGTLACRGVGAQSAMPDAAAIAGFAQRVESVVPASSAR
jgi:ribokinase